MENMDFKLNRETFTTTKVLLETAAEQSVEKDFVLPDYYPDIFKVLKCLVTPRIISHSINGGKLSFEAAVTIKVLYLSENDKRINCIEQKVNFSKSADLNGSCQNPAVTVTPKCDYINCRVVNQRRIDVRGAVTTNIKVVGEELESVVTDAFGSGIQLKKELVTYPAKRLTAAKRVTVIDQLEMNETKMGVSTVIRCDCNILSSENKMIAGKLVAKGEAEIVMLYTCIAEDGGESVENMKFVLPFSQIIDIEGIEENFDADVDIQVAGCDIIPKSEDGRSLECEMILLISCQAVKYESCQMVTDAYSTCFECEMEKSENCITSKPVKVSEEISVSCTERCCDRPIGCIYSCRGEASNINVRLDEEGGHFTVSGNTEFTLLGCDNEGMPFVAGCETPFEAELKVPEGISPKKAKLAPKVRVTACSYYIKGEDSVEIKAELSVSGCITSVGGIGLINKITLNTEKPKTCRDGYALKLCRVEGKADIWDIAKKYSTSVNAIMEENDLDKDSDSAMGMLLIPLMN